MVVRANKDLKCFVRVANNGAKYRACLPKTKVPHKSHQDLRGNPRPKGMRKQPKQLAYDKSDMKKVKKEKKEGAVRSKNISKLVSKPGAKKPSAAEKRVVQKFKKMMEGKSAEEKKKLTVRMNKRLAKVRAPGYKQPLKIKDTHKMPDGSVMSGKKHSSDSKPVKKKKKGPRLTSGGVSFTTKDGKIVKFGTKK
tara:strand:- start:1571 stop:2152 length:582 start_codon:yes stop_codon:yes gene_type:complete